MSIVENGMIFEQDVPVPVSDGNVLRANVFRPDAAGACPVIMAQGVYGKDVHFEDGFKPQWDQLVSVYPELFSNGSTGTICVGRRRIPNVGFRTSLLSSKLTTWKRKIARGFSIRARRAKSQTIMTRSSGLRASLGPTEKSDCLVFPTMRSLNGASRLLPAAPGRYLPVGRLRRLLPGQHSPRRNSEQRLRELLVAQTMSGRATRQRQDAASRSDHGPSADRRQKPHRRRTYCQPD